MTFSEIPFPHEVPCRLKSTYDLSVDFIELELRQGGGPVALQT
jgi:hypothetical protein